MSYFKLFNPEQVKQDYELIKTQLKQKIIPDSYPESIVNNLFALSMRTKIIALIGFPLLSNSWIEPLSKWIGNRKCLEIMSGCGSLAYTLRKLGIDIIPTDNFTWDGIFTWSEYWCDIENIDAIEAIEKYGKNVDIIIMSWADMNDLAYRVLLRIREVNPNCIMIYIGDDEYGCTADKQFFNSIIEIEDESFSKAVSKFQQWIGIQDYPQLVK